MWCGVGVVWGRVVGMVECSVIGGNLVRVMVRCGISMVEGGVVGGCAEVWGGNGGVAGGWLTHWH